MDSPSGQQPRRRFAIAVVATLALGFGLLFVLGVAFGARVLTYDPFLRPSDAAAQGCELVSSVEEMCRHVSALTVHAPPTPSAL